ncbi:cAMP-specific 3',5'-cyclic phosphodiesterase 4D-like isoform X1 [Tachysurus ichikawai]
MESSEPEDNQVPERFQVRRRSSRTLQLPPLAFRQAEQFFLKESEQISRPATLALSMPPLIAITLADSNSNCRKMLQNGTTWYWMLVYVEK